MADDLITIADAVDVLAARGIFLTHAWIKAKAARGVIPGAQKVGGMYRGCWLIPRGWAEAYTRGKGGRPRKSPKEGDVL